MLTSYTGARCPHCRRHNTPKSEGRYVYSCLHCGKKFILTVKKSQIQLNKLVYFTEFILTIPKKKSGVTTGKLISIPGEHQECVDCGLTFPELIDKGVLGILYPDEPNKAFCNGQEITLCPWCRPDFQDNHNGA